MSAKIETPEEMALRLAGGGPGATSIAMRGVLAEAIRARDEQIAAALWALILAEGTPGRFGANVSAKTLGAFADKLRGAS